MRRGAGQEPPRLRHTSRAMGEREKHCTRKERSQRHTETVHSEGSRARSRARPIGNRSAHPLAAQAAFRRHAEKSLYLRKRTYRRARFSPRIRWERGCPLHLGCVVRPESTRQTHGGTTPKCAAGPHGSTRPPRRHRAFRPPSDSSSACRRGLRARTFRTRPAHSNKHTLPSALHEASWPHTQTAPRHSCGAAARVDLAGGDIGIGTAQHLPVLQDDLEVRQQLVSEELLIFASPGLVALARSGRPHCVTVDACLGAGQFVRNWPGHGLWRFHGSRRLHGLRRNLDLRNLDLHPWGDLPERVLTIILGVPEG